MIEVRWVVFLWIVALARPALADDVDDLVAKGEALAKASEFTSAIEAFKAADTLRPRAKHACLIGLVYTRRELWPQAELFFARCRARATADDPLPKWIDGAQQQLVTKLTAAGAAPVTIVVAPQAAHAHITVSSFAPDEVFEPQTIHLAQGRHTIDATADGYAAVSREVVVTTSEPQTISITLRSTFDIAAAAAAVIHAPPVAVPPPALPRSSVPTIVVFGGVALGLAGGAFQLFVYKPAHDRLVSAPDETIYNDRIASFKDRRDITIGLYVGATVAVATGVVLRYTVFGGRESPVAVGAMVDSGGGIVSLAWSR
jgi:hypothetical protein